MADSYNTTFNRFERITDFEFGVLLNGTFRNGSIFNGPGLLNFECDDSPWDSGEKFAFAMAAIGLFMLMAACALAGWHWGQITVAQGVALSRNEAERMACINRVLKNCHLDTDVRPFTAWPGETAETAEEVDLDEKGE